MEPKKWRRGGEIGCGSCAVVSLGTDCVTGDNFAVKSVPLSRSEVLRREEGILSSLNSPFVIAYLGSDVSEGVYADESSYDLFMEYAPGGSLSDEVGRQQGCVKESFVRSSTFEILSGLAYIHDMGIVHCDLKGQNVLIGSDGRAKIADFGCAKMEFCHGQNIQMRGTPLYMAPEVARGEEQGTPADIWALGCIVLEMVTGKAPWSGFSNPLSILRHIGYSSNVPTIPECISDYAKDFLSKCLVREPEKRWSAGQLIDHPFVTNSENSVSEKTLIESWISPKSILDQAMWDSLTHNLEPELLERISQLACEPTPGPSWSDDDDDWVTVRCNSEAADAATTSGAEKKDVNLAGFHMKTEEIQLRTHGCGNFFSGNFGVLGGGKCEKRELLLSWIDKKGGRIRNLESWLRILIG